MNAGPALFFHTRVDGARHLVLCTVDGGHLRLSAPDGTSQEVAPEQVLDTLLDPLLDRPGDAAARALRPADLALGVLDEGRATTSCVAHRRHAEWSRLSWSQQFEPCDWFDVRATVAAAVVALLRSAPGPSAAPYSTHPQEVRAS